MTGEKKNFNVNSYLSSIARGEKKTTTENNSITILISNNRSGVYTKNKIKKKSLVLIT